MGGTVIGVDGYAETLDRPSQFSSSGMCNGVTDSIGHEGQDVDHPEAGMHTRVLLETRRSEGSFGQ
jgi:hypothetical protein